MEDIKFDIDKMKAAIDKQMEEARKYYLSTEHRINALKWFSKMPTFLEWNAVLDEVTIPYKLIKFEPKFSELVREAGFELQTRNKTIPAIKKLLKKYLQEVDFPYFIKLISRSPKELYDVISPKIESYDQIIELFTASMRVVDDLYQLVAIPECCYLVVRPYIEMDMNKEYRVFVEDSKLNGISRYNYLEEVSKTPNREKEIRDFMPHVIANMNRKDFVIDLYIEDSQPIIIEANPYGGSDPCLFKTYDNLKDIYLG